MNEIAALIQAMKLYAHAAHHHVGRIPFFTDHEFLGEVYSALDGDFDSVCERIIGTLGEDKLDSKGIIAQANARFQALPVVEARENSAFLSALLGLEKELCSKISLLVKSGSVSVGTEQMLGDICDKSEIRQYKIKQRIKK